MPSAMETLAAKPKTEPQTRQRVLEAAADLFATRGYAATSISAISRRSGVLPSSMYWEFGNKTGIFAAVLEDSSKRWLEQSARSISRAMRYRSDSADRLSAYFDYMAETLAEGPGFLQLMLSVALEHRDSDPHVLETVREHRARAIEGIADLFSTSGLERSGPNGVTAREVAQLTIACFDGSFVAAQVGSDAADLKRMFTLLYAALRAALPENSTAESK